MVQNIMVPLTYELALQREKPSWRGPKYRKILVPLDGSEPAERALLAVQELLPPGGAGILLRVISPGKSEQFDDRTSIRTKRLEARRAGAMGYLRCVVGDMVRDPGRWRCEVVVSESVPDAISDFALRENVDLIAMYSHDRRGIARLIKGSIAEKVQQKSSSDLRVLRPRELAAR